MSDLIDNDHTMLTLKGKIKFAGASIAHAGFGIMMAGVLVSSVNQHVISYNNTGSDYINATDKETKDKKKANITNTSK